MQNIFFNTQNQRIEYSQSPRSNLVPLSSGENFITFDPIGSPQANALAVIELNKIASYQKPNDQELSVNNSFTIQLKPGRYDFTNRTLYLNTKFVNIMGSGDDLSTIFETTSNDLIVSQLKSDVKLKNIKFLRYGAGSAIMGTTQPLNLENIEFAKDEANGAFTLEQVRNGDLITGNFLNVIGGTDEMSPSVGPTDLAVGRIFVNANSTKNDWSRDEAINNKNNAFSTISAALGIANSGDKIILETDLSEPPITIPSTLSNIVIIIRNSKLTAYFNVSSPSSGIKIIGDGYAEIDERGIDGSGSNVIDSIENINFSYVGGIRFYATNRVVNCTFKSTGLMTIPAKQFDRCVFLMESATSILSLSTAIPRVKFFGCKIYSEGIATLNGTKTLYFYDCVLDIGSANFFNSTGVFNSVTFDKCTVSYAGDNFISISSGDIKVWFQNTLYSASSTLYGSNNITYYHANFARNVAIGTATLGTSVNDTDGANIRTEQFYAEY